LAVFALLPYGTDKVDRDLNLETTTISHAQAFEMGLL
jgi:hypothetical protein